MTIANLTSRKLRVLIGTDQQDWSNHYLDLTIGYESLAESGMVKIEGELTILPTINAPESLSPRVNPGRWRPGVPVRFQARNDADTGWIDPSFARCILLEEPDTPRAGEPLVLRVGCKLAWADSRELDDEQSGIVYGTAEACHVLASRLLQASEIASGDISLSGWPYSIAYPFGKEGGGSFAAQGGALAWANDGRLLYQQPSGVITQKVLNLAPSSAVAIVTLGQNDPINWEPFRDPQRPAEVTKVSAVGYEIDDLTYGPIVDEVTDDLSNYAPSLSGTGIVSRVTTTETVDLGDPNALPNPIPPTHTIEVETRQLEAIIFQAPTVPGQLLLFEESKTIKTYQAGLTDPSKAKLLTVVETLKRREKAMDPNGVFSNMRTVFEKTTAYTYGSDEQIARILETTREAEFIHDQQSGNPWNLRVSNVLDTAWGKVGSNRWTKLEKTEIARVAENANVDKNKQNIWARKRRAKRYTSNRNATPPATEFFDAAYAETENHYSGQATYTHRGGSTGRNIERLFTLEFGFSDAQCAGMAAKYRDLMIGRNLGFAGPIALSDALLTAPPLPEIHVIDGVITFKYLADALSFEFKVDRAVAHCAGIWIAGGYS